MNVHLGNSAPIERLIRHLDKIADLDEADRQAVRCLPMTMSNLPADFDVISQGERPVRCCVVLDGFLCRHKFLRAGTRQIASLHIPGDLPDLQSLHLPRADYGLTTLAPSLLAFVPHAAVRQLVQDRPNVLAAFWRETLIEASVFREWIANVGQRSADERLAHLFCEMYFRNEAIGLAVEQTIRFPMTQVDLADTTGMSTVHVNRTLQVLRRKGLVKLDGRTLQILDLEALCELAGFDPDYLFIKEAA